MKKIDFKKELNLLYAPSAKVCTIVDVPSMNYLMVDAEGDPNKVKIFQDAIEALYSLSYYIKFHLKNNLEYDYVVPPLEGLWWTDDMREFSPENKDIWKWTLMIMQPEKVTPDLFTDAVEAVRKKKDPIALDQVYFKDYNEGKSAHIMHIGPYAEEAPTIQRLHDFIDQQGLERRGKHHEIYLSDPRKADPVKMKTIVRQPVG